MGPYGPPLGPPPPPFPSSQRDLESGFNRSTSNPNLERRYYAKNGNQTLTQPKVSDGWRGHSRTQSQPEHVIMKQPISDQGSVKLNVDQDNNQEKKIDSSKIKNQTPVDQIKDANQSHSVTIHQAEEEDKIDDSWMSKEDAEEKRQKTDIDKSKEIGSVGKKS